MKRILRISFYILLGSFIFIQFFRVDMNSSEEPEPYDFLLTRQEMPEELKEIFITSCYDCHSNNTSYPWYAYVAPFSWVIDQHIRNGKYELNFNGYDTLSRREKISLLDELCEVVSDSSMPPANYLMLHPEAVLTEDDIGILCDWAETEALLIMRK